MQRKRRKNCSYEVGYNYAEKCIHTVADVGEAKKKNVFLFHNQNPNAIFSFVR